MPKCIVSGHYVPGLHGDNKLSRHFADDPSFVQKGVRLFQYLSEARKLEERAETNIDDSLTERILWLPHLRSQVRKAKVSQVHSILSPGNRPSVEEDTKDDRQKPSVLLSVEKAPEVHFGLGVDRPNHEFSNDLYNDLFNQHLKVQNAPGQYEWVLSFGLFTWTKEFLGNRKPKEYKNHVFSFAVEGSVDPRTGELKIVIDPNEQGIKLNFSGLPTERFQQEGSWDELKEEAGQLDLHDLSFENFEAVFDLLSVALGTDCEVLENSDFPAAGEFPAISWSPALVLRPKPEPKLGDVYEKIAKSIEASGTIPSHLRHLIDVEAGDTSPILDMGADSGAKLKADHEVFTPLPLNDRQLKVLDHVDQYPQTVVQGPPGTGKTHMAAALISHLLAKGKRVLVTAQTEQALKEVRGKLPEEIQDLVVSSIGGDKAEKLLLQKSISTLEDKSQRRDEFQHDVRALTIKLDELQRQRSRLLNGIIDAEKFAQDPIEFRGKSYTPGEFFEEFSDRSKEHEKNLSAQKLSSVKWELQPQDAERLSLLGSDPDVVGWQAEVRQKDLLNVELPTPEYFGDALSRKQRTESELNELMLTDHGAYYRAFGHLPVHRVSEIARWVGEWIELRHRIEALPENLKRIVEMSSSLEMLRLDQQREEAHALLSALESPDAGTQASVEFAVPFEEIDRQILEVQTDALEAYLNSGKSITIDGTGQVKWGMFQRGNAKKFDYLFSHCRVAGKLPIDREAIKHIRSDLEVRDAMKKALSGTLPTDLIEPERRAETKIRILDFLASAAAMDDLIRKKAEIETSSRIKIDELDTWAQPHFQESFDNVVALINRQAELRKESSKTAEAWERIEQKLRRLPLVPFGSMALAAYRGQDAEAYEKAFLSVASAKGKIRKSLEFEKLYNTLPSQLHAGEYGAPEKVGTPAFSEWLDTMRDDIEFAHAWERAMSDVPVEFSLDQDQIKEVEARIRHTLTELTAAKAWKHAVSETRLTPTHRKLLNEYRIKNNRLGKGSGKHAASDRRDIRQILQGCIDAVPVWVMTINRVVEQFTVSPGLFDVVIVDEASQADMTTSFLQYIAPKIVVIGDDLQVSPRFIQKDRGDLQGLAKQLLSDFNEIDQHAWVDVYNRSLFDYASSAFSKKITLVEHHRCVPEIIEFSNQNFYGPQGNELVPMRESIADRVAPFKTVFVPDGYNKGTTKKVNIPEAEALCQKLVELDQDPAYAGKTFGVISLLASSGQAQEIQNQLIEMLPSTVFEERQLKIAGPSEFQGSERDVIFMSMVASVESKGTAATKKEQEQRFNVAVSRAKDEIWLFHSVKPEHLTNPEDLRLKLLTYALEQEKRANSTEFLELKTVREDIIVDNFDSRFEQKVFNDLTKAGFRVHPQFKAAGKFIDLVAEGGGKRIAIECDGDHWHGATEVHADFARERYLRGYGWEFIRIRESRFNLDREEEMARVIAALERYGVKRVYEEDQVAETVEV